jgi:hypothetical protein
MLSFAPFPKRAKCEKRSYAMNHAKSIAVFALLVVLLPPAATAKKHDEVSPAFQTAKTVYVEAADGDYSKPGLFGGDRKAIEDLQEGLRRWGRYTVVDHPEGADLIFAVRKSHGADDDTRLNLPTPSRLPGGTITPRVPGPPGDQDPASTSTQMGPDDDRLMIYTLNANGKRKGPIWTHEMKDGLDAPRLLLLSQLKDAVELAYPPAPVTADPAP